MPWYWGNRKILTKAREKAATSATMICFFFFNHVPKLFVIILQFHQVSRVTLRHLSSLDLVTAHTNTHSHCLHAKCTHTTRSSAPSALSLYWLCHEEFSGSHEQHGNRRCGISSADLTYTYLGVTFYLPSLDTHWDSPHVVALSIRKVSSFLIKRQNILAEA